MTKKIIGFLVLLFSVGFGFAQSIFENPIIGTNPGQNNPYSIGQITDPNITSLGIARGNAVSGENGNNIYNAGKWNGNSLNKNRYFEFTLTPNTGYAINFSSFVYTSTVGANGPTQFALKSSLDGYDADIGAPTSTGANINLASSTFQNIGTTITFRLYAWGARNPNRTFGINNFIFNGAVIVSCAGGLTRWNGAVWDAGIPNLTTEAIIEGDYNTSTGNLQACNITVNPSATLTITNDTYIEVQNDVTIDGNIIVETRGNFVQNDDGGTISGTGTATLNKTTPTKNDWFYYTYWSSPMADATIGGVFPLVASDRRYSYNAANFVDNAPTDEVDDNGDDWEIASGIDAMIPGVGYAVTAENSGTFPRTDDIQFTGTFNTGDIVVPITYNPTNLGLRWNFIGNPYPSAIDFAAFYFANASVVEGAAYFWSQAEPPSASNPGNDVLNFSQNDYAVFAVGTGGAAGGSPVIPNGYVPSAQGFFIPALASLINPSQEVTFKNTMRTPDNTSNSQFFKGANSKKSSVSAVNPLENRLWVNLTTDNGVFNQILVGYVENGTDDYDGMAFDAPKLLNPGFAAALYSTIENDDNRYMIQGKGINSINEDEVIKLGVISTMSSDTPFTLAIEQFQGSFLSDNTIYLKDNLLDIQHNLSDSDYTFTSEVGEFNSRFEIVFNAQALSTDDIVTDENALKIVELYDDQVQFSTTDNLSIKTVRIYDLLGRQLYDFNGNKNSETYKLSNLSNTTFIAKVELSNGSIITKKMIKK